MLELKTEFLFQDLSKNEHQGIENLGNYWWKTNWDKPMKFDRQNQVSHLFCMKFLMNQAESTRPFDSKKSEELRGLKTKLKAYSYNKLNKKKGALSPLEILVLKQITIC